MIEEIKSKIAMTHYFTSTSIDASDDMEKSQPSCSAERKTNDAIAVENKSSIKWFFPWLSSKVSCILLYSLDAF